LAAPGSSRRRRGGYRQVDNPPRPEQLPICNGILIGRLPVVLLSYGREPPVSRALPLSFRAAPRS
jgi:hypothetical protein